MVPDDSRGTETQSPAAILDAPADVHVVSGHAELSVKPADRLKPCLSKGHIATRDVLGFRIG